MNAAGSSFAGKLTVTLVVMAILIFVAGMVKTTVSAPCNGPGAWITMAGLGLGAIACVSLLVQALTHRSAKVWGFFAAAIVSTGIAVFVAHVWTLLLCRGI